MLNKLRKELKTALFGHQSDLVRKNSRHEALKT